VSRQAAQEHAKVPIRDSITNKEQRASGERPANNRRHQLIVNGDVDEKIHVVVFREHERLGQWVVTVQVEHNWLCRSGAEISIEDRRRVFDVLVPAAKLLARVLFLFLQSLSHKVVVVCRYEHWERQTREYGVRLRRACVIRRSKLRKHPDQLLLRKHAVVFQREILSDGNQVGGVVEWVLVLVCPLARYVTAEREHAITRPRSKKWRTFLVSDPLDQDFPVSICKIC